MLKKYPFYWCDYLLSKLNLSVLLVLVTLEYSDLGH